MARHGFRARTTAVLLGALASLVAPKADLVAAPRPNAYPITNVNLRAGPGTEYPVILTVPNRSWTTILGCLADYAWCDVSFHNNRGWMRSIYLSGWYNGHYYPLRDYAPRLGYQTVSFDVGNYWDRYYRDRPFYHERGRWGRSRGEGWVDRGVFYDRLSPYGEWVWLQGQYVWVPRGVNRQWRPYTLGRWVFTKRYGWMWVSNEPFGWATYHYGRWGFSNRVGWFWVPGSRWAPAWVSWRSSDDYLAWAPLPPTPYDEIGISVNISIGAVPDYYWQVVPTQEFLAPDLPRRIVRDRNRFRPILEETQPLGNVTITNNNVVVNNVVNVTNIEQKTNEKVVVHEVQATKEASEAGKVEGGAVEVFQPPAEKTSAKAAPPEPKKIEEVAAESATKGQSAGAPSTEEMLVPPEIKEEVSTQEAAPLPPPPPPKKGKEPTSGAAPPPPPAPSEEKAPAPPPAEEAAPPPSPPPAAEEAPKAKRGKGKPPKPEEEPGMAPEAPPPPPVVEGGPAPPPAEEAAPPPQF
jgi:uncharacterized protein YraI